MPYDPEKKADQPGEQEVRHTVLRLVGNHLRPGAPVSWQGYDLDLTGAVLDGGDLRSAKFTSSPGVPRGGNPIGGTVHFPGTNSGQPLNQHSVPPPPRQRPADQLLVGVRPLRVGGVDQRHAWVERLVDDGIEDRGSRSIPMPEHGLRGRQGEQRPAEPGAYGWVRFSARGPGGGVGMSRAAQRASWASGCPSSATSSTRNEPGGGLPCSTTAMPAECPARNEARTRRAARGRGNTPTDRPFFS